MPEKNNERTGSASLAVFCDFENIAIGVRESRYADFDISRVLERLLLKGSIVVKKAYCDWDRYKDFKKTMHETAFELIEIPHVRQSGKNSADIRMVVDALDLCYTKPHVNTFAVMSGDSDFTPLVTKLRENNKTVIGVGVKNSTSDLFTSACDEFIFYDDLVREHEKRQKQKSRRKPAPRAKAATPKGVEAADTEDRKQKAFDLVLDTIDMLWDERGEDDDVWGSMVKQAIKRRQPGFNESYYGFRGFNELLRTMEKDGLLKLEPDERSGGYIILDVRTG
jgi:uncharacterized protein (TIGR00288 family)